MPEHLDHSLEKFQDWDQAKIFFRRFSPGWAFRGQGNSNWTLTTSIERAGTGLDLRNAESDLFDAFTRAAHQYLDSNNVPTTTLEWFALMQHHGTPTRLLDWTRSPYVASYFAFEDAESSKENCAVWAIDTTWCKVQAISNIKKSLPALGDLDIKTDLSAQKYFDQFFFREIDMVVPVEPYRQNQRMTTQQGIFLSMGIVNRGFLGNLLRYQTNELSEHIVKIELPNTLRAEALFDLYKMNVNRATLFPGIDGFAQSLRSILVMQRDNDFIRGWVERNKRNGFPYS